MKNLCLTITLILSCLDAVDHATAQTATWIWYPGDMDIWTGSRINDLRTENGSYYPAFWRNDYHYQTVEFSKTFQLDEAEEVAINAEGHYGVRIDSHGYLFGMPKTFTVPIEPNKRITTKY